MHTQLITKLSFVLKSKAIHQKEQRKNKGKGEQGKQRREKNMYHRIYARANWVSGK